MNDTDKIEGYKKIVRIVNKYDLASNCAEMSGVLSCVKRKLFIAEFEYNHNIALPSGVTLESDGGFWVRLPSRLGDMSIGTFGTKHGRNMGCVSNVPKSEILLSIRFCTGPFTFGEDYPKEFFNSFFDELISIGAKYTDRINSELYFSMDNATEFMEQFPSVCEKYLAENRRDILKRKCERLEAEAEEIKAKLKREVEE